MDIIVRAATANDAEIIAQTVAMAIGDEVALRNYCGEEYLAVLAVVAAARGTQYSWEFALVAEVDGIAAGAIVGYDGAQLHNLREGTFSILREKIGRTPTIDDETEAGEYYLDSVGVLPEFRSLGVGKRLIEALCKRAFDEGHTAVGLIVDQDNPHAEQLYTALGFIRLNTRTFFHHPMWHMQRRR